MNEEDGGALLGSLVSIRSESGVTEATTSGRQRKCDAEMDPLFLFGDSPMNDSVEDRGDALLLLFRICPSSIGDPKKEQGETHRSEQVFASGDDGYLNFLRPSLIEGECATCGSFASLGRFLPEAAGERGGSVIV